MFHIPSKSAVSLSAELVQLFLDYQSSKLSICIFFFPRREFFKNFSRFLFIHRPQTITFIHMYTSFSLKKQTNKQKSVTLWDPVAFHKSNFPIRQHLCFPVYCSVSSSKPVIIVPTYCHSLLLFWYLYLTYIRL